MCLKIWCDWKFWKLLGTKLGRTSGRRQDRCGDRECSPRAGRTPGPTPASRAQGSRRQVSRQRRHSPAQKLLAGGWSVVVGRVDDPTYTLELGTQEQGLRMTQRSLAMRRAAAVERCCIASQTTRAQQKAKPLRRERGRVVVTTGTCHKLVT